MPSLLGGVQSPAISSKVKATRLGGFSIGNDCWYERSLQVSESYVQNNHAIILLYLRSPLHTPMLALTLRRIHFYGVYLRCPNRSGRLP